MMNLNNIITVLMVLGTLVACSKQEAQTISADRTESGELTKYTLIDASNVKNKLVVNHSARTNLVPLPIDSKFNAEVFVSKDTSAPEFINAAFLAPKVMVYGARDGGNVVLKKHPSGNVSISFNMAFIDGRSESFLDSKSLNKISVPNPFRIQNWNGLESVLTKQYQVNPEKIGSLSGCPRQINVIYAGREYDVTPSRFLTGERCQFEPITVSLTVTHDEANDILYNQLPNGMIDVGLVYETKTNYPLSKTKVTYQRKKTYDDLYASLKGSAWFLDVDVSKAVRNMVTNQNMIVNVQGDIDEATQKLISKITGDFFIPFRPDPESAEAKKCENTVCFQLNSTVLNQQSDMSFEYNRESSDLVGYTYVTSTKVQSVNRTAVTIGRDQPCEANCDRVTSDDKEYSTGLSVSNGDVINIKPEVMFQFRHQASSTFSHRDNQICLLTYLNATGLSVNQCNSRFNIAPGSTGATVCNSCYAGAMNQWVETTSYLNSYPVQVIGNPGVLALDGLSLVFKGFQKNNNQEKVVRCPIGSFTTTKNGDSLDVVITNTDSCHPFDLIQSKARLFIQNHGYFKTDIYQDGNLVIDYSGVVRERPTPSMFNQLDEMVLTVGLIEKDPYGLNK